MFVCEFCGVNSKPGEKLHMVPTQLRPSRYGVGTEIVREKKCCPSCYLTAADYHEGKALVKVEKPKRVKAK